MTTAETIRQFGLRGMLQQFWAGAAGVREARLKISHKMTDPTLMQIFGWDQKENKLVAPYKQLPVIHACINAKARNIAQVPFRIHDLRSDEVLEEGPLFDLFENVNPVTSKYEFFEGIVVSLDTRGNWFVYPDPEEDQTGIPFNLWLFSPKDVKPAKRDGNWVGWEVKRGKEKLIVLKDEMVHGKYYNPDSEIEGLAPLEALKLVAQLKWDSMQYSKYFFENDATPSMALEMDKSLTDAQRLRMKEELYESRKGVEKSHGFLLLEGGLKAKQLSFTQKDIQLLETMKLTTEEICMVFKVPKTELSIYENVNYATALSQDRAFWQKTLIPIMKGVESVFNTSFLNALGYYGKFDLSVVDALTYELLEKVAAAEKLVRIGFTANEVNERLNLGFEEQPWRDEPMTYSAPAAPPPEPEEPPEGKALRVQGAEEPERISSVDMAWKLRSAKWKKLDDEVLPLKARAAKAVRNYFKDVEQKIRRELAKGLGNGVLKAADPLPNLDMLLSDEKLRGIMEEFVEEAITVGSASIAEAFPDVPVPDPAAEWIATRANKVSGINETVRADLRVALREAIELGLTEEQTADLIMERTGDVMEGARNRAKTIARTEIQGAYSDGRWDAMVQTDPPKKRWLSSRDDKVRPTHVEYEGEGAVPFKHAYGGGMQRPHDPAGSAEEVINCRCQMLAIYEDGEVH